jgi:hypothetical protein
MIDQHKAVTINTKKKEMNIIKVDGMKLQLLDKIGLNKVIGLSNRDMKAIEVVSDERIAIAVG